jgi:hypothetical protein
VSYCESEVPFNLQVRDNNYLQLQYVESRAKQYVITPSGGGSVNSIYLMKTEVCAVISLEIVVSYDVTP